MKYEVFCDTAYFDQWAVRPIGENRWGHCYHLPSKEEAIGLAGHLERLEREDGVLKKIIRERDEWRNKFELSVDAVEISARAARAEMERDEAKKYLKWIHDLADSQKKWTFRTIAKEGLMKMEGGK
jgi:hypothetical protein